MSDTQQPKIEPKPSQRSETEFSLLLNVELRAGGLCPRCRQAGLDYDGLLNLSCLVCHYVLVGCST